MYRFTPYILILLCINFYCSEFNNPITPTHIYNNYYRYEDIAIFEITLSPSKLRLRSSWGFYPNFIDTPAVVLYLKTDVDFTKKYPVLNEQNSTFKYTVFYDSTIAGNPPIDYYTIILLSIKNDTADTSYLTTNSYYYGIEVSTNLEFINYPKKLLWQVRINQRRETYILPPEPYAYIF